MALKIYIEISGSTYIDSLAFKYALHGVEYIYQATSPKGNIMSWNLESLKVSATYLDTFPVTGKVTLSRVKYNGTVSHHITLDKPITVYGSIRDRVIIDHKDIKTVSSS